MIKASIIIPIYNVEQYVCKAIESSINQTEKEIEIVLVDDGSTDNSLKICEHYAKQDNRIQIVHKENGGLSSARNAGVNVSIGEFILFLDGDDYLNLHAVERLLQVMNDYPCDFIQFRYKEVQVGEKINEVWHCKGISHANTPKEIYMKLYELGGIGASGCTKFYKRELLEKIPFESVQHEDEMWCTRAFQYPLTVTYIQDELYYYVMREGSIVHSWFNKKKLDVFKVAEERVVVLNKLNLSELLHFEYERMFISILRLYCEAKYSKDKAGVKIIKEKFKDSRKQILKLSNITGKLKIILKIMYWFPDSIYLYYIWTTIQKIRSKR